MVSIQIVILNLKSHMIMRASFYMVNTWTRGLKLVQFKTTINSLRLLRFLENSCVISKEEKGKMDSFTQ